jgi:diguanylate cyclase (GGDEF)-like protein
MSTSDGVEIASGLTEMIALPNCNSGGEDERLAAFRRYEVLDTEPEEAFDKITHLVKSILAMPMAVVSLVDRDRKWFKSRQGMADAETPRNISFCTHTIQGSRPLIVTDAHAGPRFSNSPLVVGEPHIRFYVGVPLRSRDGYNIGALCSMDTKVRHLSAEQIKLLEGLASLVVDELELRVRASTDSLTGVMSRRSFGEQAAREIARSNRHGEPLSCALIDIDHFKTINDTYGHGVGDLALKNLAKICSAALRACDYIGCIGGEEFAILLPATDLPTALEVAERLRIAIETAAIEAADSRINITARIGVAGFDTPLDNFEMLLKKADVAMYAAKNSGRNRVCCHQADNVSLLRGVDARSAEMKLFELKCRVVQ